MTSEAAIFHNPPAPVPGKLMPAIVGSANYHVLSILFRDSNLLVLNKGVEVGVLEGETSAYLLKNFPNLTLSCVDPYVGYEKFEANRTQEHMSDVEKRARQRLSQYGSRAVMIKDFSVPAAAKFQDNSLDFVFIDALHTYEAVTEDIKAWYPKIRKQGMILGHDVSWAGVREAVEDFTAAHGLAGFYTPSTSDIWFFVKP